MRRTLYIIIACILTVGAAAESKADSVERLHEIRLGCGDQLFETLIWHNPTSHSKSTSLPPDYRKTYAENYKYSQHIWVEYHYRQKPWFSVGVLLDCSGVSWDNVTRDGLAKEVSRERNQHFYNIVLMPTLRFTYLHLDYVNLYSGFGIGMDINGGTEKNMKGNNTAIGAAMNLTVIGVSANYDRYFGAFDLGGMFAMQNKNTVYMLGSRIMTVSIGVRF